METEVELRFVKRYQRGRDSLFTHLNKRNYYTKRIMTKRFLYLLVAMVGMTLQSVAQDGIAIPKFTKLLKITDNVNFRQEPNTTSAKLMQQMEEMEGSDKQHPSYLHKGHTWGNAGGKYIYRTAKADYLMVIDETPEWYHGYALLGSDEIKEVYVSKKVAKVKSATKITGQYLKKCIDDCGINYSIRTSGEYKGYYLISGDRYSLESSDDYLFVGKCVDGICFGKLYTSDYGDYSANNGFAKLPSGIDIKVVSRISDMQIKQLLEVAQPGIIILTTGTVVTYYPKGSEEWDGFASFYYKDLK